jgi:hypothetical protein
MTLSSQSRLRKQLNKIQDLEEQIIVVMNNWLITPQESAILAENEVRVLGISLSGTTVHSS